MNLVHRARVALVAATLERHLTWMLGSPRSGTTWLAAQLGALTRSVVVDEPLIGAHLAVPLGAVTSMPHPEDPLLHESSGDRDDYFFSRRATADWRPALNGLIARRFASSVLAAGRRRGTGVLVKEPNGSLAAPQLLSVTPRSRLIFVVRDGRDVVDSLLDGASDGWITKTHGTAVAADGRREFIERRAHHWVRTVSAVQRAHDAHDPSRRIVVTYEAMRDDPEQELSRLLRWLGRTDALAHIPEVVARHAFERLPSEHRGRGQFARAATPGLWREHLSRDEQDLLASIMGPSLSGLGYR
jgi:hypothetical protein